MASKAIINTALFGAPSGLVDICHYLCLLPSISHFQELINYVYFVHSQFSGALLLLPFSVPTLFGALSIVFRFAHLLEVWPTNVAHNLVNVLKLFTYSTR